MGNKSKRKKAEKSVNTSKKAFDRGISSLSLTKKLLVATAIVIVASLLCAVAVIGALFLPIRDRTETVTVPDYIGLEYDGGIEYDSRYFELDVGYEYCDGDEYAVGTVIDQSPSPGAVRKLTENVRKCTLELTVSLGEKTVKLEDFCGTDSREAENRLKSAGFEVSTVSEYSERFEVGEVIYTEPAAGETLAIGDNVTLFVSLGVRRPSVSVPDLVGMSETAANATLLAYGLQIGNVEYVVSHMPAGTVISQSPVAVGTVARDTKINLRVSAGLYYGE